MLDRRVGLALLLVLFGALPLVFSQGTTTASTKDKDKDKGGKSKDVEMVERLLASRREYQMTLETLRAHYIATGDIERARWAEEELLQFHRITKQAYILELDVPPPTLQGIYNIPEANELYRRAMTFKDKGMTTTDYTDNQRRAELLLQQLLSNYPTSDKISDTAYQLGDLYESKAYKMYGRAAQYFERCFQWNPKTQLDARMRAARLYEKQLNERARAIELYKEVTTHEIDNKRVEEAQRRLTDLGAKK
jgi:tetratricopeptide (TPR) repeat protein